MTLAEGSQYQAREQVTFQMSLSDQKQRQTQVIVENTVQQGKKADASAMLGRKKKKKSNGSPTMK